MSQKRLERYISHCSALELIQICLQGELSHRRIGGVVVGIERFVLPTCADLARMI